MISEKELGVEVLQSMAESIRKLRGKCENLRSERDSAKKEVEEKDRVSDKLSELVVQKEDEITLLMGERDGLKSRLQEAQNDLKEARNLNKIGDQRLEQYNNEVYELEKNGNMLREKIENLMRRNDDLAGEKNKIQSELDYIKSKGGVQ